MCATNRLQIKCASHVFSEHGNIQPEPYQQHIVQLLSGLAERELHPRHCQVTSSGQGCWH